MEKVDLSEKQSLKELIKIVSEIEEKIKDRVATLRAKLVLFDSMADALMNTADATVILRNEKGDVGASVKVPTEVVADSVIDTYLDIYRPLVKLIKMYMFISSQEELTAATDALAKLKPYLSDVRTYLVEAYAKPQTQK